MPSGERLYDKYAETVLIPLSKANTFNDALREWYCDGEVYDFETESHFCELRSTGPSRFLLQMSHRDNGHSNGHSLRINVSTALMYNIAIYGDNHLPINPADCKRYLREKLRICRVKQYFLSFCTAVLRDADALKYMHLLRVDVTVPVLPSQLIEMAKFMAEKRLPFDVQPFTVDLESDGGWHQFVKAPPWLRWKIWGALSPAQLAKCQTKRLIMAQGYDVAEF